MSLLFSLKLNVKKIILTPTSILKYQLSPSDRDIRFISIPNEDLSLKLTHGCTITRNKVLSFPRRLQKTSVLSLNPYFNQMHSRRLTLHKKCTYSQSFWPVFSRIWIVYREILHISPYSVQMQKNTDRYRYFKYSHFSHSVDFKIGKETTKNLDDSLNIKKPRLINNPTNTPRVFYIEDVETTVSTSFQRGIHVVCL